MNRVRAEQPVEIFGAGGLGRGSAFGEEGGKLLRGVLGGDNPDDDPPRIGERASSRPGAVPELFGQARCPAGLWGLDLRRRIVAPNVLAFEGLNPRGAAEIRPKPLIYC
jgi:hypothetical protein